MKTNGAATVFHVSDLERSITYYVATLGFTERFRFAGEYAGVEYGEVQIHLSTNNVQKPAGSGQMYVFCDAVDEYYADIVAKGAKTPYEPKDWPYGMRDFQVEDPDGNLIAFGAECVE